MKIGVFDSGVGGLSVVKKIEANLPEHSVIFKNDAKHVPYGTREINEIYEFIRPIMWEFIDEGCKVIVIACNTVTTNLISRLRSEFDIPFVGLEPMVKPAAQLTKTGVIAVCATPRTLQSERYQQLKADFAKGVKVLEPDCSDWAKMIESDSVDREKISKTMDEVCDQDADVIVLGCTHYHWIEEVITKEIAGRADILQPEDAVIAQLTKVLEQLA